MIDGHWIDIFTIVVAVAAACVARLRHGPGRGGSGRIINDLLNGASLAPFIILFLSAFNNGLLDQLIKASKVSLAIAGLVGCVHIVREIWTRRPA